jgi:hypothetical protein
VQFAYHALGLNPDLCGETPMPDSLNYSTASLSLVLNLIKV